MILNRERHRGCVWSVRPSDCGRGVAFGTRDSFVSPVTLIAFEAIAVAEKLERGNAQE